MLDHVYDCGGDEGLSYVSSSITNCSTQSRDSDDANDGSRSIGNTETLEKLKELALLWLWRFLFMLKISPESLHAPYSYYDDSWEARRPKGPKELEIAKRERNQCKVTQAEAIWMPLGICRILSWPLEFHLDSEAREASMKTFDIIRKFSALPCNTLDELAKLVESPSNGFLIRITLRILFYQHNWCLKKLTDPNHYNILVFQNPGLNDVDDDDSEDEDEDGNPLRTYPDPGTTLSWEEGASESPLPDPKLLSVHCAVTQILQGSGVGKFFREVMDNFNASIGNEPENPFRSWEDLDKHVQLDWLKYEWWCVRDE